MKRLQVGDECYVRDHLKRIWKTKIIAFRGKCIVVSHGGERPWVATKYTPVRHKGKYAIKRVRLVYPLPCVKDLAI